MNEDFRWDVLMPMVTNEREVVACQGSMMADCESPRIRGGSAAK
jgi:hypothetical protein